MSAIAYQLLRCYDLLINKNEVFAQTCQIILYVAGLWLFLLFAISMLRLLENNSNETIFSEIFSGAAPPGPQPWLCLLM